MITKRTVFVLGAGASIPYGFPSGADLRQMICDQAGNPESALAQALIQGFGADPSSLAEFGTAFRRSQSPSIDAFLAYREDFSELGKLCMAFFIARQERADGIYACVRGEDWYHALWGAMIDGVEGYSRLASDNQVRFVSFNYDRSLEFMLHEAAKNTFRLNDDEAAEACRRIQIRHVYGSLGPFGPGGGVEGRPYSPAVTGPMLRLAANGLRVIPEARHEDPVFLEARKWFEWAEQICFLGFGFDPLNMQRLGLDLVMEHLKAKKETLKRPQVIASTYRLTEAEVNARFKAKIGPALEIKTVDDGNLMTLRLTGVLI